MICQSPQIRHHIILLIFHPMTKTLQRKGNQWRIKWLRLGWIKIILYRYTTKETQAGKERKVQIKDAPAASSGNKSRQHIYQGWMRQARWKRSIQLIKTDWPNTTSSSAKENWTEILIICEYICQFSDELMNMTVIIFISQLNKMN